MILHYAKRIQDNSYGIRNEHTDNVRYMNSLVMLNRWTTNLIYTQLKDKLIEIKIDLVVTSSS